MTGELPPEIAKKPAETPKKLKPPKAKATEKSNGRMAKAGATVVVLIDGDGPKRKGARHKVLGVATCHGKKFYRLADEKGKPFHLAPASARPA